MSRTLFLFNEALMSLRRNVLIVAGAILAVFVSLAVAFTALVFNEVIRVNTLAWQDGTHVIAFLWDEGQNGVPGDAHAALLAQVEQWPEVEAARYHSKTEAWIEYQELFVEQPELQEIDPTVLPASIRVELVDIGLHGAVRFRLEQQQLAVRRVATADQSIQQLQDISRISRFVGLTAAVVLGVAAVVLIANTIRLAIYARRDEVSIMKLVGASNWFIRVPFVMEGLFEGLVGAFAAGLSVWLFFEAVSDVWSFSLFRLEVADDWFLTNGLIVMVFGALAGVLGSLLGLSRHLRDADGAGADVPTGF